MVYWYLYPLWCRPEVDQYLHFSTYIRNGNIQWNSTVKGNVFWPVNICTSVHYTIATDFSDNIVALTIDRLINCLDSIVVECQPTTQAAGIRISAETFLSRDASLKDGENPGQVPP